jgi:hypothetical protein
MVVISFAIAPAICADEPRGPPFSNDSDQTREQETDSGRVANVTISVLPITVTVAHASVNAALSQRKRGATMLRLRQSISTTAVLHLARRAARAKLPLSGTGAAGYLRKSAVEAPRAIFMFTGSKR